MHAIFTNKSSRQLFRNNMRPWTKHIEIDVVKNFVMSIKKRCSPNIFSNHEQIKYEIMVFSSTHCGAISHYVKHLKKTNM
jgi:hypothetical protein